jgi:two-component system sensor histidine kinase PrrB
VFAAAAGVAELVVGRRAARPLARLRAGAESIDRSDPATWSVDAASGTPDVDVAAALNAGLAQLADATARRAAALDAARAFAASAAHELRTPLQSALTNLDIAASAAASAEARAEATDLARGQLRQRPTGSPRYAPLPTPSSLIRRGSGRPTSATWSTLRWRAR